MEKSNQNKDTEKKETWWSRNIKAFGIEAPVLMIMGVLIGIILTAVFILSIPSLFVQPFIANAVSATVAAQPTTPPISTHSPITAQTPPDTLTQMVQITPSPDERVLRMDSIPSRVFPYAGGTDSQIQGSGLMSISYDDEGEINFTLDYSLPASIPGKFTWAGIAIQFQPMSLAKYQYIEVAIKFSDSQTRCEIKFVDKSDNTAYFRLGGEPSPNSGVVMTIDGDRQIIRVPLRGNFDSVNLEQIREVSFSTSDNLGTGNHSFTVSRIKFIIK